MTKKLCTYVGCRAIVEHDNDGTSPRCKAHKKKDQTSQRERKRRYKHHYDDQGRNIYSTYRWKKLSKFKRELNPLCEICESFGIATKAVEVDHIKEIEDGGPVWDINNLQSICRRCHLDKTDKAEKDRKQKRDEWGYLIL